MIVYLGIDDTDTLEAEYGTGKLVRWFQNELPQECSCKGVVRQQLFVSDQIPYTSHNSAACMIVDMPADDGLLDTLIERAVGHLERHFLTGSDPGLCVAAAGEKALTQLIDFGLRCTRSVSTQRQAVKVAHSVHLSGHGGTNDGIIGAAAAVGLTASGWSGRFIEMNDLRSFPDSVTVMELKRHGIETVSMDRDTRIPAPEDRILTRGWIRPRLLADQPVLFVCPRGPGQWENIHCKRKKG
jgi:hypothetical protein